MPVLAGLVGALFYFAAPPPLMHARMATDAVGGADSGTQAVTAALFAANRIDAADYPKRWQQLGGSSARLPGSRSGNMRAFRLPATRPPCRSATVSSI